jgi:hypothetical protein
LSEAVQIPTSSQYTIGPGFLPMILAIACLVVCGILLLHSFILNKFKKSETNDAKPIKLYLKFLKSPAFFRMGIMIIASVVFVFLMHFIGILMPTVLFMVFVFFVIDRHKWLTNIKVAVLTTGILYLIFDVWLQVQLPHLFL